MASATFDQTSLNTVKRYKHRASYSKSTIYDIVRAAPVLHVAFVSPDGLPQCIPMAGALELATSEDDPDYLYIHGSSVARFFRNSDDEGLNLTVTATLVDGFILSLTPYSHDVQYRSACLHCVSQPFSPSWDADPAAAKLKALERITEAVCPGRWASTRPSSAAEVKSTGVLRLRIVEASAKINADGPHDADADVNDKELVGKTWAGHVPIQTIALPPVPCEYNTVPEPEHVTAFAGWWEARLSGGKPKAAP